MANKTNKISTNSVNSLQFISEDTEIMKEIQEAQASLADTSPYVRWAKFILTDDQPNGNGVRIPVEEFDNLIRSGIHMPIKMASGKIEEDHSNASPIGVITNLKKEFVDGINRIVGLAALWLNERPGDVTYLKSKMDGGEDINISWEIGYGDAVAGEITDYKDVALQAATIVGNPAYQGRTRFLAMASNKKSEWSTDYIESLPDSSFLYIERGGDSEGKQYTKRFFPIKDNDGNLNKSRLATVLTEAENSKIPESYLGSIKDVVTSLLARFDAGASLEEISKEVAPLENNIVEEDTVELKELEQRVSELESTLASKEQELTKANESLASLSGEKDSMTTELEQLRTFKKEIDDEVAKVEKLDAIKAKFSEASLEKDEKYFAENSEKLLNLSEDALNFMIQEFAAFSKADPSAEASLDKKTIPNFTSDTKDYDAHEIAVALKERAKEKRSKSK